VVSGARQAPADPAAAKARAHARTLAHDRAAAWLARAHPEEYRDCYQQALTQLRASAPGLPSHQAHQRASRQARADLRAVFHDEYAARFDAELAALQPPEDEQDLVGATDGRAGARARLRALLWLAAQHPDLTGQLYRAEAARLPLNPSDRVPRRRRALAWARALEGLRRSRPEQFLRRYRRELAKEGRPR
jgi:hypothetical protein